MIGDITRHARQDTVTAGKYEIPKEFPILVTFRECIQIPLLAGHIPIELASKLGFDNQVLRAPISRLSAQSRCLVLPIPPDVLRPFVIGM